MIGTIRVISLWTTMVTLFEVFSFRIPDRILRNLLVPVLLLLLSAGCSSQGSPSGDEAPIPNEKTPEVTSPAPDESGEDTPAGQATGKAQEQGPAEEEFDEKEFGDDIAGELDTEFSEKEPEEVYDPFSGYNRAMTVFNDKLYIWALDPAARGVRFVLPEYSRKGIANFFDNLLYPLRLINNLLQAQFADSGEETLRFVTNTTIGILGFWDPAEEWFGLEAHDEDFGQTLGYWGVGPGPHIVLPVLGPSNLRDTFSLVPDYYLEPVSYVEPRDTELSIRAFEEVNDTSLHIGEYENLKRDAIDLYPFLRDVYEQNRAKKILE